MENLENNLQSGTGTAESYEAVLTYRGFGINIWVCLLLSILTSMISILSTSTLNETSTSTVFIVFVGILIIMYATYMYGFWGIITAILSSLLFCLTIKTTILGIVFNVGANAVQALLVWVVFRFSKISRKLINSSGEITDYQFLVLTLGILYIIFSFIFDRMIILYVFFAVLIVVTLLHMLAKKEKAAMQFLLFCCLIPSLSGAIINAAYDVFMSRKFGMETIQSVNIWTLSNTVLFGTFGYLMLSNIGKLNKQKDGIQKSGLFRTKTISIKLSTAMFYVATVLWNILFYVMYLKGWLNRNTYYYLFPWVVGNIFFITNLIFTQKQEFDNLRDRESAFDWFEKRAVVAENNTQMMIAIIAFLLPLCADYLGYISEGISFLFMLNITSAVISLGLIWVPRGDIRTMEIVKHLKTIFHLYTLSLLLLSVIMIVNQKPV